MIMSAFEIPQSVDLYMKPAAEKQSIVIDVMFSVMMQLIAGCVLEFLSDGSFKELFKDY